VLFVDHALVVLAVAIDNNLYWCRHPRRREVFRAHVLAGHPAVLAFFEMYRPSMCKDMGVLDEPHMHSVVFLGCNGKADSILQCKVLR
jgi:hypothetical protein